MLQKTGLFWRKIEKNRMEYSISIVTQGTLAFEALHKLTFSILTICFCSYFLFLSFFIFFFRSFSQWDSRWLVNKISFVLGHWNFLSFFFPPQFDYQIDLIIYLSLSLYFFLNLMSADTEFFFSSLNINLFFYYCTFPLWNFF